MHLTELRIDVNPRADPRELIEQAAEASGLVATQVGTLAKYPGCIHWHFKRSKTSGTLEATYWPEKNRAWLSYRSGREADWIAPAIEQMKMYFEGEAK